MQNTFDNWRGNGEELRHYGVLGMKWGERRYQNPDGTLTAAGKKHYDETGEYGYHYKSHATKKYNRKAVKALAKMGKAGQRGDAEKEAKYEAKYKKYTKRAERSAEVDRGEQEYAKSLSTGKAIALSLLSSPNALKGYAQYRAMAKQTGNDITGKKILAGIKAYRQGAAGSRQRKAAYIRQDEGKNGLGQKVFRLENKIENAADQLVNNVIPEDKRKRRK